MSSPLPPDPYSALGVSKDADVGQIRTAHRKLVLKFHPDRIKGDDSDEKEKAKNEFQKVQQAYELLVDQTKRSRYDDQVKLAELRREKMMHEASRPATQSSRTAPGPTTYVRREMRRDGNMYEERAPPSSYFDDKDQFDDSLPRTTSRKHESPYEKEKERKPSVAKSTEKRERTSTRTEPSVEGISSRVASALGAKARQARESARESTRSSRDKDRDGHARNQEMKDRKERRERSEKHSSRRNVELESGSDSDTVVPPHKPIPRPTRSSARPDTQAPRIRTRSPTSRRGHHTDSESYDEEHTKWERHHKNSMDYIAESQKRPSMPPRNDSDAYFYWGAEYSSGRRSGSDSERKPPNPRRTRTEDVRARPSMPAYSSAPDYLRPFVEERAPEKAPQRSKTSPYQSEREPRSSPSLNRAQTMPVNKSSKKDNIPIRGSNLKQMETQDSGYYSNSNPHTPEMKGESPPPSRETSKKKGSNSTKYIVEDDEVSSRVGRVLLHSDDERQHRRTRSPEQMDRHKQQGRTRPSRGTAPSSYSRNEFDRYKSNSPRVSPTGHGRKPLYGEIVDDKDASPQWRYDTGSVKTAAYRPAATASYDSPRVRDDFAYPNEFREHPRNHMGRRPSAAH